MKLPNPGSEMANFYEDLRQAAEKSNGFVLEIGVAKGDASTYAFQEGLLRRPSFPFEQPLHISVDQRDYMLWKPPYPWWYMVVGDSRQESTLAEVKLVARGRTPGVIFIDTDHDYDQMSAELPVWSQTASDETVWLFHDTYMFGPPNTEMVRAITEFAAANHWVYEDFRTEPHGLGRMRR